MLIGSVDRSVSILGAKVYFQDRAARIQVSAAVSCCSRTVHILNINLPAVIGHMDGFYSCEKKTMR